MKTARFIDFVKMQGTGNDFVVLDLIAANGIAASALSALAPRLCERKFGIGGDGLLSLETPDAAARAAGAQVRMQMWNPDGTIDMCGNGLRCIAALAHQRAYVPPGKPFIVQTLAGLREVTLLSDGRVRAAMGAPQLASAAVPIAPGVLTGAPLEYQLPVAGRLLAHVSSLSTGSTHTVIFGPPPSEADFQTLSPLIESHDWFPERTSVMWASLEAPGDVRLRIWERGVGETLACGTGACATAVVARLTGRVTVSSNVRVHSRGGTLEIAYTGKAEASDTDKSDAAHQIYMTGPAETVFSGHIAR